MSAAVWVPLVCALFNVAVAVAAIVVINRRGWRRKRRRPKERVHDGRNPPPTTQRPAPQARPPAKRCSCRCHG